MTRGRKPKPTVTKALEGNAGKRPPNDREPRPRAGVIRMPPHLEGEAAEEWSRISAELKAAGVLTMLDAAALAAYCQAWGRWVEAETQLRKHGPVVKSPSGYPIQNPYLAIANGAMKQMLAFMVEFGLTPSSRSRIRAEPDAPAGDDFDL
jgi:P27 family predicted phage terminase small subunit